MSRWRSTEQGGRSRLLPVRQNAHTLSGRVPIHPPAERPHNLVDLLVRLLVARADGRRQLFLDDLAAAEEDLIAFIRHDDLVTKRGVPGVRAGRVG